MKWMTWWRTWLGAGTLIACMGPVQATEACKLAKYGTLPVEMIGARATTQTKVNGADTRFTLDTGAEFNFMSRANADALGLQLSPMPSFSLRMVGIGGKVKPELATIKDFGILGTDLRNIQFEVGGSDSGEGMVGANLLDIGDLEIDLAQGKVNLFQAVGCDKAALAYWAVDGNYYVADLHPTHDRYDKRSFVDVTINGKTLLALLDSGAAATSLTRQAAERVGIDVNGPGVKVGGFTHGIGDQIYRSWIMPVDAFSVGTETIHHSPVSVIDGDIGRIGDSPIDMVLGVDFMLAHHIYIANGQRRLYFTYNGGRMSTLDTASIGVNEPAAAASSAAGSEPATAADYALRGQARLARGELAGARSDLDAAIRLDPNGVDDYLARARIMVADKQPDAALGDLDKALSLDPKNLDALLLRARLRYAKKDEAGVEEDVAAARQLVPAGSMQSYNIASLYVAIDRPVDALPLLDDWISTHGSDALLGGVLNVRCRAGALANQSLDDALYDCRKAIKRDGEYPDYLQSLGLVYLRMGKDAEAIKAYQRALVQSPHAAWSHYGLGLAELHSGQTAAGNIELAMARLIDKGIDRRAAKFGLAAPGALSVDSVPNASPAR